MSNIAQLDEDIKDVGAHLCRLYDQLGQFYGVPAMPRALGAPFGAVAQQRWTKRELIHARLRIARKEH